MQRPLASGSAIPNLISLLHMRQVREDFYCTVEADDSSLSSLLCPTCLSPPPLPPSPADV